MNNQHEPSVKEVFSELSKDYFSLKGNKKRLNKYAEKIKKVAKNITDYSSENFLKPLSKNLLLPYIIPTISRKGYEKEASKQQPDFENIISRGIMKSSLILGGGINTILLYNTLKNHNGKTALIFLASTNTLSGLYELGRKAYYKKKQEIIQRRTLENIA